MSGYVESEIRLRTLGDLALMVGSRQIHFSSRRALALLVYLSTQPGRRFTRDHIASLFWGEKPQAAARHSLSQVIYRLRHILPEVELQLTNDAMLLRPDVVWTDVTHIRYARTEQLASAILQAYGGAFLEGFHVASAPNFEHWRDRVNYEMEVNVRWAFRELAREAKQTGDWLRLEELSRSELNLNAENPEAVKVLAEAIAGGGDPVRAIVEVRRLTRKESEEKEPAIGPEHVTVWHGDLDHEDGSRKRIPRFIGREAEFAKFRQAWCQAELGEGSFLVLGGEAGIGKTRLAIHALRLAALRGARVFSGRCYASERQLPFSGIANALNGRFTSADLELLPRQARSQVSFFVGGLADFPSGAKGGASGFNVPAVVDALSRLLRQCASPGVLFLDDIHWADERTVEFLFRLARYLRTARFMVLAAYRSEEISLNTPLRDALRAPTDETVQVIPISELTGAQVADLITEVEDVRGLRLPLWLRRQVAAQAAGRPLFILEAVRAIAAGALPADSRSASAWPRGAALPTAPIEQLLTRRLETLAPQSQSMISALAVIGREAPLAIVQRVARLRLLQAAEALKQLLASGVLTDLGSSIAFTHDVMREAAYRAIPPSYRRVLHSRAAAALAQVKTTQIGTLAIHYDAAGMAKPAYAAAVDAATNARQLSAPADEEFFLRLALANACDDEGRRLAESSFADMLALGRRYEEADEVYQRLRSWYEAQGNDEGIIAAEVCRLAVELSRGCCEATLLLKRARSLAARVEKLNDLSLQVRLIRTLVSSAHDAGDVEYLDGLLGTLTHLALAGDDKRAAAEVLAIVANAQCIYSDAADALNTAQRAVALASDTSDPSVILIAQIADGQANLVAGKLPVARHRFEAALRLVDESECKQHRDRVLINYAVTLMEMGDNSAAIGVFEESIQVAAIHDQVVAAANLAAIYCDCEDTTNGRLWAARVQKLNSQLGIKWADLLADSCLAYCALLEENWRAAYEGAARVRSSMSGHLRSLGDCSHTAIFLARILERQASVSAAHDYISGIVRAAKQLPFTGRLRLQLEEARLFHDSKPESATRAVRQVISAAVESRAHGVAASARRLLEQFSTGRSELRRCMATNSTESALI